MKIIHTSDWHIGHRLYNRERDEEFGLFIAFLLHTIKEQSIDALVVSGDVFDVAYPSNKALTAYYNALLRIKEAGCAQIFIVAGNHDSVGTLQAPSALLAGLNITVISDLQAFPERHLVSLSNAAGKTEAYLALVPFLRDKDIRSSVAGEGFEARTKAIREGIVAKYNQIAAYTETVNLQKLPVIATGHLYAAGVSVTESERDIHIGNLGQVSAHEFSDVFSYVALGHIHRPQIVAKREHIRYSGSPIPLSFSECEDQKSIVLLTISGSDLIPEVVPVPNLRKLISVRGTHTAVLEKLQHHESTADLTDWFELEIREPENRPEIREQLEKTIADCSNLEVLKYRIIIENAGGNSLPESEPTKSLKDFTEVEVFESLLKDKAVSDADDLKNSFLELMDQMDT